MLNEILGHGNAWILIPVLGLLVGLICALASYWFNHKKAEMEAALKQDMIRQGMSADDIIRVLEAKSGPSGCGHRPKHGVSQETTDFRNT